MSLIRQLWLTISVFALVTYVGCISVASISGRSYLEQQLHRSNQEHATTLARSLGAASGDADARERMIKSEFDTGNYDYIRLDDLRGNRLSERVRDTIEMPAPQWYVSVFPLAAAPGIAEVRDGETPVARLSLTGDSRIAYETLWAGAQRQLLLMFTVALITGIYGTITLRRILRPLNEIMVQAEAMASRRFITNPEPATPEFRAVVRSMNQLTESVRSMLREESRRLDLARRETQRDAVTGLLTRGPFLALVESLLAREDDKFSGIVVICRLHRLDELNRQYSWPALNMVIAQFGKALHDMTSGGADWASGRLNGSEFALLAPMTDAEQLPVLAQRISDTFLELARIPNLHTSCELSTAAAWFQFGDTVASLLGRVDTALDAAATRGGFAVEIVESVTSFDLPTWRQKLDVALGADQIKLVTYPVVYMDHRLLHEETAARVRWSPQDEWLPAGQFMPWLTRFGIAARLDARVVDLALERLDLRSAAGDICVNFCAQTMNDAGLLHRIASQLNDKPELARRLWFELPERDAFENPDTFRVMCALLKPVGCRIGIAHAGNELARLGELHDAGLDYLKIDASFVHEIDLQYSNQLFLRGLTLIARSIGLITIAEGVRSEAEWNTLANLGLDGATGPAVTAMMATA